jgi:hypothetical protein
MSAFHLAQHAISRMTERGIGIGDIELIGWIGTQVDGGYLVRKRDFEALDREPSHNLWPELSISLP